MGIARRGEPWLHILLWSLLLMLPYLLGSRFNHYSIGPLPGLFFTITGFLHIAMFYLNAFFLYPRLYTLRRWFIYVLSAIGVIVLVTFIKHYILITWFSTDPTYKESWRLIGGPTLVVFFASILYRNITDKRRTEKEKQLQTSEALSNELKFLRSQISPHFLFNVLTNLVALARKKSAQLEPSLLMLSGLMRYMLYDTRHSKILLQQEIAYLESYIALQQLRFGDEIRVDTDLSFLSPDQPLEIEPMLLIPFVENAFKHGIGYTGGPWIQIRLMNRGNLIEFEVNNGYTEDSNERNDETSGIGIENVSNRLRLLYNEHYSLNITRDKDVFSIQLMLALS